MRVDPGHFLGNPHTLSKINSEFAYPDSMNRDRTDTWETSGKPDLMSRARAKADAILDSHFPNYFGAADAQVRDEFPIVLDTDAMTRRA